VRVRTGHRTLAGRARPEGDAGDVRRHLPPPRSDDPGRIGCPVAAAALARPEDPTLAAAATAAFESWEGAIVAALEREGVEAGKAATFSAMVVSTIEGALVRTRAAADLAPLDSAIAGLEQALDGLLNEARGQRS
jgi:hypothetical protein